MLEKDLLSPLPAYRRFRPRWAVAKARYLVNLYAAGLAPADTHHRDPVAAVLADFAWLCSDS